MAKMTYTGFEIVENQLAKLDRGTVRRLVEAGANAVIEGTRESIRSHHHVATGSMMANVKAGQYHETLEGGWMEVYPQETDGRGVSNAKKAFVINYGYGKRRTAKTGDKFITGAKKRMEAKAAEAMEKENQKIINEANGEA